MRRFVEGSGCSFGDRCNYAHGEQELRPLNQEGQDILAKRAERDAREQGESSTRDASQCCAADGCHCRTTCADRKHGGHHTSRH